MTFGYKNKFNGPIRALTAIAIGVVMVMSKANALELVVKIIAVFLLASGLVSLFVGPLVGAHTQRMANRYRATTRDCPYGGRNHNS